MNAMRPKFVVWAGAFGDGDCGRGDWDDCCCLCYCCCCCNGVGGDGGDGDGGGVTDSRTRTFPSRTLGIRPPLWPWRIWEPRLLPQNRFSRHLWTRPRSGNTWTWHRGRQPFHSFCYPNCLYSANHWNNKYKKN